MSMLVAALGFSTRSYGCLDLSACLQNFALNVAEKGFDIAVYNRSYEKTEACVKRAEKEGVAANDSIA